jgi:energy-coupling factor transport system permease protein
MKTKGKRLHRLDPRPKLMLMASASTACMLSASLLYDAVILCVLLLTLIIGGADMHRAFARIRALLGLIVLLFIVQVVFGNAGAVAAQSSPMAAATAAPGFSSAGRLATSSLTFLDGAVTIHLERILFAALLSARLIIILVAALVLLEGETRDYLLAFVQMRLPYEIAFSVSVGLHFLPILRDEAGSVYRFMQLRGKDFRRMKLAAKVRAYAALCLPVLVGALRRANEMSIAAEIRGFRAMSGRTFMRRLKLSASDIALMLFYPPLFGALYVLPYPL